MNTIHRNKAAWCQFTQRHWELYELLLKGYSYIIIAKELGLAYNTVSKYFAVMRKITCSGSNLEMLRKVGILPNWYVKSDDKIPNHIRYTTAIGNL